MQGRQLDVKQGMQAQQQQAIYNVMIARGASPHEALGAALHPELAKALIERNYAKPSIETKDGAIVYQDPSNPAASRMIGAYPTFQKLEPGTSLSTATLPMPGGGGAGAASTVVPGMSIEEKKAAEVRGEATEKQRQALPGAISRATRSMQYIDELKNHPDLWLALGPTAGRLPAIGGGQAEVVGRIDQIKARTFLDAYDQLRGAGAITEAEGKKAEDAQARLNRAQRPEDFKRALDDLREILIDGLKNAHTLAKQPLPANFGSRAAPRLPPPPSGFVVQ